MGTSLQRGTPAVTPAVDSLMSETIPIRTTPGGTQQTSGNHCHNWAISPQAQQFATHRQTHTSFPTSAPPTTPRPTSTILSFNVCGITFENENDSGAVILRDITDVVIVLPQRTRPEHKGDCIATLNFHPSLEARIHVIAAHLGGKLGSRTKLNGLLKATGITVSELSEPATECSAQSMASGIRIRLSFPPNMMILASCGDGKDFLLNDNTIRTAVSGRNIRDATHVSATDPPRDHHGFVFSPDPSCNSGVGTKARHETADSDTDFNAEGFLLSPRTAYEFQAAGGISDDDRPLMAGRTAQSPLFQHIAAANRITDPPRPGENNGRSAEWQGGGNGFLNIQTRRLSSSSVTSGIPEEASVADSSPPRRSGRTRLSTFRNSSAPTPIQSNLHHQRGPDGKFVPRSVRVSRGSDIRRQVRSVSQRSGHQGSQKVGDEIRDLVVGARSRQSSTGRRRSGLQAEVESLLYAHNKYPKGKTQSLAPVGARRTRNSGGYGGF